MYPTVNHVNKCMLQLVMDSYDEAAAAHCMVTVYDSQAYVTDNVTLTFSVQTIPPGQVCKAAAVLISCKSNGYL